MRHEASSAVGEALEHLELAHAQLVLLLERALQRRRGPGVALAQRVPARDQVVDLRAIGSSVGGASAAHYTARRQMMRLHRM